MKTALWEELCRPQAAVLYNSYLFLRHAVSLSKLSRKVYSWQGQNTPAQQGQAIQLHLPIDLIYTVCLLFTPYCTYRGLLTAYKRRDDYSARATGHATHAGLSRTPPPSPPLCVRSPPPSPAPACAKAACSWMLLPLFKTRTLSRLFLLLQDKALRWVLCTTAMLLWPPSFASSASLPSCLRSAADLLGACTSLLKSTPTHLRRLRSTSSSGRHSRCLWGPGEGLGACMQHANRSISTPNTIPCLGLLF